MRFPHTVPYLSPVRPRLYPSSCVDSPAIYHGLPPSCFVSCPAENITRTRRDALTDLVHATGKDVPTCASPSWLAPRRDHTHGLGLRTSRWSPMRAARSPFANVPVFLLIKVAQKNGVYCSGRWGARGYT